MRLIPCPENVVFSDGGYVFGKKSGVFSTSDRARKAFDDFIGKFCGYPPCDGNDILFKSDGTDDNSEEYSLEITPSGISVDAKSERGLFYGVQTLKQIIAVRMDDKTGEAVLPSLKITDKPRFSYRGFMFDCVRHFFPVETVKKYIDAMAILKLNVFHWHLTDDQGWRVEIDGYPELITTGSKRRETMRDKTPHGGYYTKDDVREIVNYASDPNSIYRDIPAPPLLLIPNWVVEARNSKFRRNSEFTAKYFAREKTRRINSSGTFSIA